MFSDEPGDYILSSLSDMFEEPEQEYSTEWLIELEEWLDEWNEPEDYFIKDLLHT